MDNKIDCHILLTKAHERYHAGCLASLATEPVNIHTPPPVMGHIGRGRMAGFILGSAPYVSFVDDDDEVIPGSYQMCIDALEANPGAIGAYPDEILIDAEGNELGVSEFSSLDWTFSRQITLMPFVHHGVVMRRESVMPLLPELERWRKFPEQVLFGLLVNRGNWIHVPVPGYKWRRHGTQVTATHGNNEITEVVHYLADVVLNKR